MNSFEDSNLHIRTMLAIAVAVATAGPWATAGAEPPASDVDAGADQRPWAAAGGPTGLGLDPDARMRGWVELGLFSRDGSTLVAPTFGFGIRLAAYELTVTLPLVWQDAGDSGDFVSGSIEVAFADSTFEVGNPTVGMAYLSENANYRFKVGGEMGIPAAQISTDPDSFEEALDNAQRALALLGATAIRGLQQPHWYQPNTLSFVGTARLERDVGRRATLSIDGAIGGLLPTDSDVDSELFITFAPSAGLWLSESPILLGIRTPIVSILTAEGDATQVALEPYLVGHNHDAFVSFRATLPLDEPFGPFTDDGRAWGVFVTIGGQH